ncbi:unnamed protein product, partial [Rhizoctonia solani]
MSSLPWKIFTAVNILGISVANGTVIHAIQQSNTSVIPWTECPDVPSTQCATFNVPLDYTNPDWNETVSIFLRKYPATAPEDQWLGSLLTNPGGPGGSGSEWVLRRGKEVSEILDGRYDVIGFDPRFSYGSILGATFAALKPNLVKRMVLDGVSDSESYYNDVLQWGRDSMQDTNKTMAGFASTCIEAGPEYCALANKSDTAQGILDRLEALYTRLDEDPLVFGDSPYGPGIIQAHHVQNFMLTSLYRPDIWRGVAEALVLLEQGVGLTLSAAFAPYYAIAPRPYAQNVFNRSMQTIRTREEFNPILCGDSAPLNITIAQYTDYFREMGRLSGVGESYATITGRCRGWPFRAKERFPILFVSLDGDPVTPLGSAVKMSKAFESSSVLVQHGPGFIYPTNATKSKRAMLGEQDARLLDAVEKIG